MKQHTLFFGMEFFATHIFHMQQQSWWMCCDVMWTFDDLSNCFRSRKRYFSNFDFCCDFLIKSSRSIRNSATTNKLIGLSIQSWSTSCTWELNNRYSSAELQYLHKQFLLILTYIDLIDLIQFSAFVFLVIFRHKLLLEYQRIQPFGVVRFSSSDRFDALNLSCFDEIRSISTSFHRMTKENILPNMHVVPMVDNEPAEHINHLGFRVRYLFRCHFACVAQ